MQRELMKGNEAVVRGAIMAGCTHYFGYPITPSSEVIHAVASIFPQIGACFVQAESEIAAINMCYGAAAAGRRVMTASSGPGISLKQEGVSYLAAAELPCVIINITRAGPGLGNIFPEQGDYSQIVKGGGHGNYRCIVLAPSGPQEMCDLTYLAFDLADQYTTPVYVMADGQIGQMMAPVAFSGPLHTATRKDWAVYGDQESRHNLICSIRMTAEAMEQLNLQLQAKYQAIERQEIRYDLEQTADAKMVIVAYGICARIAASVVTSLREQGMKVGLLRPITLYPFPRPILQQLAASGSEVFVSFELSNGQMVEDVRLSLMGTRPVEFYGRMGGMVPSLEEVSAKMRSIYQQYFA